MINYLIMDGRSSLDFGLVISGGGTETAPEKRYEEVDIPGRNGKLLLNTDTFFNNVTVEYKGFMFQDRHNNYAKHDHNDILMQRVLSERLSALRSFLGSRSGYFRIEDTYHRDEFRLGYYSGAFEPEMSQGLDLAQFTLKFVCKPQRFLKAGEEVVTFTANSIIHNPTEFDARPLIRAYGTGSFTANGVTIKINSANSYTDIDCDLMECYKGSTNCNGNVTLTNGVFPVLAPGDNSIKLTGVTKLEITPRWWVL